MGKAKNNKKFTFYLRIFLLFELFFQKNVRKTNYIDDNVIFAGFMQNVYIFCILFS